MKTIDQNKKIIDEEGLIFDGIAKMPDERVAISDPRTGCKDYPHGSTIHIKTSCFSKKKLRKKIRELRRTFNV